MHINDSRKENEMKNILIHGLGQNNQSFNGTKEYLKKRLNIFEILGALANIYTLIIPAVIVGCSWCQVTVVGEKVAFLYDYENFQWIVMIASFVLGLIMILFSKLEEKKL